MASMSKIPKVSTKNEDALLTVADVARLDQTSVCTTRRAIKAGLIKVLRVGPKGHLVRVTAEADAEYRQRLGKRS
jgi:hypothetical protein